MKNLMLLLFLFPALAMAQDSKNYDYNKNVVIKNNTEPFYVAGEMAFYEYVFNKLEYSRDAIDVKLKGEAMLSFNVNADSTLSDFSVVTKVGYGVEEAIIAILKDLKFAPGLTNGKPATKNLLMSFPIEVE